MTLSYPQQMTKNAEDRLEAMLKRPMPKDRDDIGVEDFFYPWEPLDGVIGAYDGTLDIMAVRTIEAVVSRKTFDLMKGEHGLFVQFFLHMLCEQDYCDYGTSPRGAFPGSEKLERLMTEWAAKWREWYVVSWGEPFEEPAPADGDQAAADAGSVLASGSIGTKSK